MRERRREEFNEEVAQTNGLHGWLSIEFDWKLFSAHDRKMLPKCALHIRFLSLVDVQSSQFPVDILFLFATMKKFSTWDQWCLLY